MSNWYERVVTRSRNLGKNRIILDRDGSAPYLERVYFLNRWWSLGLLRIFIHRFWKSDDDNGWFHSHPWLFWGTYILKGGYIEHTPDGSFYRKKGDLVIKSGWAEHYVELLKHPDGSEKECWTFFFVGPKIKSWGFFHPDTGERINWRIFLKDKL